MKQTDFFEKLTESSDKPLSLSHNLGRENEDVSIVSNENIQQQKYIGTSKSESTPTNIIFTSHSQVSKKKNKRGIRGQQYNIEYHFTSFHFREVEFLNGTVDNVEMRPAETKFDKSISMFEALGIKNPYKAQKESKVLFPISLKDLSLNEIKEWARDLHNSNDPLENYSEEEKEKIRKITDLFDTDKTEKLFKILSVASHFQKELGGKNEFKFVVPHHIDVSMKQFGITVVEIEDIDMMIDGITISNKSLQHLVHTEKGELRGSRNSLYNVTLPIIMGNSHPSRSNQNCRIPKFDILCLIQLNPFICFGFIPYSKVKIDLKPSGSECKPIPLCFIKWIIDPYKTRLPITLLPEQKKILDKEVQEIREPTLFKRILAV